MAKGLLGTFPFERKKSPKWECVLGLRSDHRKSNTDQGFVGKPEKTRKSIIVAPD